MVMSWIFTLACLGSLLASWLGGGGDLTQGIFQGAQQAVQLVLSMAGPLCLWSGVGNLLQKTGAMRALSRRFRPLLGRIFPDFSRDEELAGYISGNFCANLLGLGNAATPMGIQGARRLAQRTPGVANNQLCRLVVLNTASVQLLPTTVASLRAALGSGSPLDILVPVWLSSVCSVSVGLLAARLMGGRDG